MWSQTAHKKDLAFAQIFAPDNTPPDLIVDSETLWNAVEVSEKRKDARLAKEFKIALPAELTPEQSIELTAAFVLEHFTKQGIIADVVIHDINGHNPHIHIMGTTREILSTGFGKKSVSGINLKPSIAGVKAGRTSVMSSLSCMVMMNALITVLSGFSMRKPLNRLRLLLQTKRKQSGWLKLLKRTVIQYFISLVTVGALLQLRNNVLQSKLYVMSLKEAGEAYFAFKDLPLDIVVDVASFRVHALAEPEEIVIPDNTGKGSSTGSQKPVLVAPAPHTRATLKTPSSSTARALKRAPVKVKRKKVEPRQSGVFKRFTLLVVDYIREKFVWAKKKPVPVSVDAEHDKRIAENYVFDEVQGIYVSRSEHERRARFNSDDYKPTKDEVRRFPSRPKHDQTEHNISLDLITPIQSERQKNIYRV